MQQPQMALKWKRASSASRSSPPQNRSRFSVRSRFGQRRLCRRRVRTTTSGLSPGETLILPFRDGLLGGTSQPGCQSVRAPPPRFSCRRPGVRCRRGCQAECSTRGRRWEISCASAECDFFFIFFARKPQVFGLQTFHRARLQRDHAKHAERPFAHPSYRIRPIISTIASYDFFIYKYYINNV